MPVSWRHKLNADTLSGLQIFQLLRYGSFFIIAIILPRSGIIQSDIGIYESFLFFAGIVTFFWLTGLIQGMLPWAGSRASDLFNATLLLFVFALLSGGALCLLQPLFGQWLNQELPTNWLGWIILYIMLTVPATVVEYWYVIRKKTKWLLRYGILASTVMVLSVGLPAILTQRLDYVLYGLLSAGAFRFGWMLVVLIREGEWKISGSFMKRNLAAGLPIGASVLISGSAQYVDGFIVTANFDAEVFAIFRYGARELPLVAILAHALSNALIPAFRQEGLKVALNRLKTGSERMARWMFPLTALTIVSTYLLFPLLFGREFTDSAGVFNLYLLLITSRLLFPQTIIMALQKNFILFWASVGELILNVGLSLWFVQFWGIRGIALATVVAYLFERLILMVWLTRKEGILVSSYVNLPRHLSWSVLLIGSYIIAEWVVLPLIQNS